MWLLITVSYPTYLPTDLLVRLLITEILSKYQILKKLPQNRDSLKIHIFSTIFVNRWLKSFFPMNFVADTYLVCQKSIFEWFLNFTHSRPLKDRWYGQIYTSFKPKAYPSFGNFLQSLFVWFLMIVFYYFSHVTWEYRVLTIANYKNIIL